MIKRLSVVWNQLLLISILSLLFTAPVFADIDLTSPSSTWTQVLVGSEFDPAFDQQSAVAVDMFGTSLLPHYYMKYDDAGTPNDITDDEVAFRFRVVQTGGTLFDGNIWLGLDVDSDSDLDAFIMLSSQNSVASLGVYDTAASTNISPNTTSNNVASFAPVNSGFAFNYTLTDTIDRIFRRFSDSGSKTYYVSYKVNADILTRVINQQTLTGSSPVAKISTLNSGVGFINTSAFQLVVASAQSASALNGDIAGYNDQLDNLSDAYKVENAFSGSLSFANPQPINAYTQTTTITSSLTTLPADAASTSIITVQLKDSDGNNLTSGGVDVSLSTSLGTLSSVTDNANGTYTATLTSSITSGTAVINGTLNGSAISDDAVVIFGAGVADATTSLIDANPTSIVADGVTTSAITVQLKDAAGNNINTGGDSVSLTTNIGALTPIIDNNNGTYSATLTSSTTTGVANINGDVNGNAITDIANVNFVTDSASAMTSTLSAGSTSLVADGMSSTTIIVQLKDSNGNNLTTGGDAVTLSATLGSLSAVVDNADGTYSAQLTSAITTGSATITGSVNGTELSATQTIIFVAGNASVATSTVTAIPTTIMADGFSTSNIVVQLIDANGNRLSQGGDQVLINSTLGRISVVTDNNDGSYSAQLISATTAGLAQVTATLMSGVIVDNATVSFVAIAADSSTSTITAVPGSITADGVSVSLITVQLKDSAGVNLTQGGDTVILNASLGTLSAVIDNADGTYAATLTSTTTTGVSTITGSVNGSAIASSTSVTFAPGIVDVNVSELSASELVILADGVSTSIISVQLKDINGNNLTVGGNSVELTTSAGLLTSVTDLNNGVYQATLISSTSPATAVISAVINGASKSNTLSVVFASDLTLDTDNDGIINDLDLDDDNDGVLDTNEGDGQVDSDADGIMDSLDLDSDGDGLYDLTESAGADTDANGRVDNFSDVNANGYDDALEINPLLLLDSDQDGVVNRLDLDSDNDGLTDVIESAGTDTNGDGRIGPAPQTVDSNGVYTGGVLSLVDTDNDGIFNAHDLDSDNDGIPDVIEAGGNDAESDGVLGTGIPVVDVNGIANGIILIPVNTDGTDLIDPYDLDADDDGLFDLVEGGGNDSDNNGTVDGFVDDNADGFDDFIAMNPLPLPDSDFDGIADYQDNDDTDNDGIIDSLDIDTDNDGIPDDLEGSGLIDTDGDGIVDSLDLDSDNDGLFDLLESGIVQAQLLDLNNDGRIDASNIVGVNGLADIVETFADSGVINYNNGVVVDSDDDGVPDYLDLDSDNDGIPDVIEAGGVDPDGDGIIGGGTPLVNNNGLANGSGQPVIDTDGDGIPDYLDLDSDNDGVADLIEIGNPDVDNNGVIDGFIDDNNNGLDDRTENTPLPVIDSDDDGIPDYLDNVVDNTEAVNNNIIKTSTRGSGALNMWLVILMMPLIVLVRSYQAFRQKFILFCLILILMIIASSSSADDLLSESDGSHFYAGFAIGQSSLSPDTTGTIYSTTQDSDSATKIFLGVDVTEAISTEISFSDLGSAKFNPTGEIDYSVVAISALYYLFDQNGSDHQGWGGYLKTGLSTISNSANIPFEQENSVQLLFGAGITHGWSNGLSARIEVDSYDEDASMISVGLVYRFGKAKNKVLHNLANDKDSDGVSNTNDQCPGTEAGRSVNEIGCEFDGDGDGIKDSLDLCPQTPAGLIVESNGCL